ncbi:MAG TPA: methyl-accepting chemotaxis protein [Polyangiaceae bacterium]
MGSYTVFVVVLLGCLVAVVGGVYLRFRSGLATRLFSIVLSLIAFNCLLTFIMGAEGDLRTMLGLAGLGAVVTVPILFMLYRTVVTRVEKHAEAILASTVELSGTAKETAATAAQQSATVTEISATIRELTETSNAAAAFAQEVMGTSSDVQTKGEQGMQAVEDARAVLELISQVGEIVESVRDFANQSNLLAVNARVEAAKAGEHGRGFAVVASEIRSLAEQSRESAQRIWKAVGRAEGGRRALDEASTRMKDLLQLLGTNVDNARQISATVGQQSAGIEQISEALMNVAEGGQASAAATGQVEQAVLSLRDTADALQTYIRGKR